MRTNTIQRAANAAFSLAAVTLLGWAILCPGWIERALQSRLGLGVFAVGCGGFAFLLHPELRAELARGIHEFRKASREVQDDNDRGF